MPDAREVLDEIGYASEDYPDDARFIAHARTDVPKLVAALRAVLDLHRRIEGDITDDSDVEPWCAECRQVAAESGDPFVDDPCPTVRAITEALGGIDGAAGGD